MAHWCGNPGRDVGWPRHNRASWCISTLSHENGPERDGTAADQCRYAALVYSTAARVEKAKTREEVDTLTAHRLQLANGLGVASWFAKNRAAQVGDLIAANDQCVGVVADDCTGLGLGKAQSACFGLFSGEQCLIDGGVCGLEWQAQARQKLTAEWRGRGED